MTAALAVVIVLAAVGWGMAAGREVFHRRQADERRTLDHLSDLVRLRLVVHTKDERSIRGVLIADYPDCILLDAPEYLGEPQVQELAGRAVILRPNLAWIQVLSDDGS